MKSSEGMGNGMSDFTAKFGITGMLIFLAMLFRGFLSLANRNAWQALIGLAVIALALQGEAFLSYPLFLGLMVLCPPTQKRYLARRPVTLRTSHFAT